MVLHPFVGTRLEMDLQVDQRTTIRIWDVAGHNEPQIIKHRTCVQSIDWSPDGTRFVGLVNGTVQIWK